MNIGDRVVVNRLNQVGRVTGFLGRGHRLLLITLDQGGQAVARDTDCKLLGNDNG